MADEDEPGWREGQALSSNPTLALADLERYCSASPSALDSLAVLRRAFERLTGERDWLDQQNRQDGEQYRKVMAERDRLRAALEDMKHVASPHPPTLDENGLGITMGGCCCGYCCLRRHVDAALFSRMRDAGAGAPGGATASERDDSNIAKVPTEPHGSIPAVESSTSSTSGPEATSSQGSSGNASADP